MLKPVMKGRLTLHFIGLPDSVKFQTAVIHFSLYSKIIFSMNAYSKYLKKFEILT